MIFVEIEIGLFPLYRPNFIFLISSLGQNQIQIQIQMNRLRRAFHTRGSGANYTYPPN